MPNDTTSPFTPGRPVPVEFFVGREKEIERLKDKVAASVLAKRIEVAFVSGERGIGKSSLASFVRFLCERDLSVLGLHTFLGGVTRVPETVKRIIDSLLKQNVQGELFKSLKALFGKRIREVGLFGVSLEFAADEEELNDLADHFAAALRSLLEKASEKKGLLLILDDINGLGESPVFGNWVKSFVDESSVSGQPLPLSLLFVGLDERRHALLKNPPSLSRVFDPIVIEPWSREESEDFFVRSFKKAGITCEPGALQLMSRYVGGLPVLAHEIGDATFHVNKDRIIDLNDATSGVFAAADIVGRKYLDPLVFKSLRSERYRTILRKMAKGFENERFTRARMREVLDESEQKVLDNFLQKMKTLNVIVEDPDGGRGAYRFSTSLHYLYFGLEALRQEKES